MNGMGTDCFKRLVAMVIVGVLSGCGGQIQQIKPEVADRALFQRLGESQQRLDLQATVLFPPGTEDLVIVKPPYRIPVGETFVTAFRDASYAVFGKPGASRGVEAQKVNLIFELLRANVEYAYAVFSADTIVCEFEIRASVRDARGQTIWSKNITSRATSELKEAGMVRTERPMALFAALYDAADQFEQQVATSEALIALLPPDLTLTASLVDANGDGVLEGGEAVKVAIEVANKGRGVAQDLEVELSGTQALLSALGTRRGIGTVMPGQFRIAVFDTILPAEIPAERGVIQVEVKGQGFPMTLVEVFDVGVKSRKPQVVAGDANLGLMVLVKDTNGNGVIENGEDVTVGVELTNSGKGPAEDVEVALSGDNPFLMQALSQDGSRIMVGAVQPGEKRRVNFRAVIPNGIASGQAAVDIDVKDRFTSRREGLVLETLQKASAPRRDDAYAVVIGIEKYRDIAGVEFATRDARTVQSYLTGLMGVPEENTLLLVNERATRSDISNGVTTWLKNRVTASSTVFVYYAGHGAPQYASRAADNGPDSYLVPYDGDPNNLEGTSYAIADLYAALGALPAKEVVVALDSCFSGTGGRSVRAAGTRPIRVELREPVLPRSIVTLSAAKDNQISTSYPEKQHGLFTYYLLQGLKGDADSNRNGWVEMKELFEFVKPRVEKQARLVNLQQTPTVSPASLGEKESLRLAPVPPIEAPAAEASISDVTPTSEVLSPPVGDE